ncbi:MAG: DEAD/DEAH box helicase [Thermoanaerobaculia bacterium]
MSNFSDFGLDPDLLRGIESVGFEQPTPIQQDAIPPALAGRDVLACAMTGSGKTAAFLLPILHRLKEKPRGTTRVLVLAPTRELAAQIVEHMTALAKFTDMKGAAVFGGVAMGPQEKNFRKGVDVLVATPGRLLDHFQNDYAKLEGLEILVLDEADRMLDMGFLPDVRRVLQHLPRPEQTLFFSATLPPPIVELAGEMLREPARLNVERKSAPATGITQAVYPVQENLKPFLLVELLRRGDIKNVLVFTRTKHRANRLADFLEKHGVPCDRIHGNRSQVQRTDALSRFKSGDLQVLVATDIAARGIDVEALSHVINFDVPNIPEDYIHRVGRTARAEMVGDAFTFVSDEETAELQAIEREVGSRLPRRTVEGFDYAAEPADRFEVPLQERIAAIRTRRAEERARARAKAEKKAQREAEEKARLDQKAKRRPEGRPAGEQQPRQQGQGGRPAQPPRGQQPPRQGQGEGAPRRGDQQPRRQGDQQPRRGDQQPRRHGGGEQQPRHRHVAESVAREVDPTTKPTEERLVQIRNAFSPTRFNRFRR